MLQCIKVEEDNEMGKVKFLREPGYIYDLFFLFTLKFNKEYCLTNFINYDKSSDDTDYFNKLLNDFPPISDELLLFFYLTDDKKSFMTKFYFEPYKEQFVSETYNIMKIQDVLSNYEQVVENIIRFYFRDIDEDTLEKCKTSMSAVNKLIKESDYNGDIKSALYSFFIEPAPIIRRLSYELMEKDFALNQKYDNYSKQIDGLKESFDLESLSNGLKNDKNQIIEMECFKNVFISFCMFNKNCVKSFFYDKSTLILLGIDYCDVINYLAIQNRLPDLEAFGNAISESNRIEILDLLLKKDEITIKDLEQEFGFTGTNAYYHLSLMIKAGMLKTRNRGRTVLYSINKNYFQILCNMLGKYYKE